MEMIGTVLLVIGALLYLFSLIWFLVVAFRESILWGLLCLFIPLAQLIFLIIHWREAKRPFGWMVLALIVSFIGALMVNDQVAREYMH